MWLFQAWSGHQICCKLPFGQLTQLCFPHGEAVQEHGQTEDMWDSRLQVTLGASKEWVCCFVAETDNSCKVCCRDEQDRCVPYVDANDQFLFLRKGKPCTVGFCDTNVSCPSCQCTACSASVAGGLKASLMRTVLVKRNQSLTSCWAGWYSTG